MAWSIGIDLGGTNIGAGLVDEEGRILGRIYEKTRAPRPAEDLVKSLASCVSQLVQRHQLKVSDLTSIGIGLPGVVDAQTGRLLFAANLALAHIDFPSLMARHFPKTPIYVGNDADCAALGEYLAGGARAYPSVLLLTLGTGLGGGFIYEDRIFRGATGTGIEPGHLALVAEGGRLCSCGQEGCLEAYVSIRGMKGLVEEALAGGRPSLLRDALEAPDTSFNTRLVFDAVLEGDELALEVLQSYVHYLAMGIRSLVVLYRPHIILLGGGISRAGDLLLLPLEEAVRKTTFAGDILPPPPIRISQLGNDAGIIGAALLHTEQRN